MPACSRIPLLLTLLACCLPATVSAHAETERAAARDLAAGQAHRAWPALAALEDERAGDVDFDLLFGQIALESGEHTRAVMAFERVLESDPGRSGAWLGLGRALYEIGEFDAATNALRRALTGTLSADDAARAQRTLQLITRIPESPRPSLGGHVELSLGRDTNVNSASTLSSVALPAAPGIPLTRGRRAMDDEFGQLSGAIDGRMPLTERWTALAGARGFMRMNEAESRFSTRAAEAYGGIELRHMRHRLALRAEGGLFQLDNETLRDHHGLSVQWHYTHDVRHETSAGLQHIRVRYDGSNAVRDIDRSVFSLSQAYRLHDGRTLMFASLHAGREAGQRDLAGGANIADAHVHGIRVGIQHEVVRDWTVFAALSHDVRRYTDVDPVFQRERDDRLAALTLGLRYRISEAWHLLPSLRLARNDSNIDVNDYRRFIAQFAVRHDF